MTLDRGPNVLFQYITAAEDENADSNIRDVVLGCEASWTLDRGIRSSVVFVSLGGMKCDRSADGHIVDDDIANDIASLKQNTMSIDCPPLLSAY